MNAPCRGVLLFTGVSWNELNAQQQHEENIDKTSDIEKRKRSYANDQADEDAETTKRIEELKRKQNEKQAD